MRELLERLEAIERNTLLGAKQVLTRSDVAILTGLTTATIYKLTTERRIPHYKPNGRLLYFDRKEIEEWMKQNRVGTTQEAERETAKYLIKKKR